MSKIKAGYYRARELLEKDTFTQECQEICDQDFTYLWTQDQGGGP